MTYLCRSLDHHRLLHHPLQILLLLLHLQIRPMRPPNLRILGDRVESALAILKKTGGFHYRVHNRSHCSVAAPIDEEKKRREKPVGRIHDVGRGGQGNTGAPYSSSSLPDSSDGKAWSSSSSSLSSCLRLRGATIVDVVGWFGWEWRETCVYGG